MTWTRPLRQNQREEISVQLSRFLLATSIWHALGSLGADGGHPRKDHMRWTSPNHREPTALNPQPLPTFSLWVRVWSSVSWFFSRLPRNCIETEYFGPPKATTMCKNIHFEEPACHGSQLPEPEELSETRTTRCKATARSCRSCMDIYCPFTDLLIDYIINGGDTPQVPKAKSIWYQLDPSIASIIPPKGHHWELGPSPAASAETWWLWHVRVTVCDDQCTTKLHQATCGSGLASMGSCPSCHAGPCQDGSCYQLLSCCGMFCHGEDRDRCSYRLLCVGAANNDKMTECSSLWDVSTNLSLGNQTHDPRQFSNQMRLQAFRATWFMIGGSTSAGRTGPRKDLAEETLRILQRGARNWWPMLDVVGQPGGVLLVLHGQAWNFGAGRLV